MRYPPARRTRSALTLLILTLAGCNSTGPLAALKHDRTFPPLPLNDVVWKKSVAPSTALAHDQGTKSEKSDEPVQSTNFQQKDSAAVDIPPIPEVMVKDTASIDVPVHTTPHKIFHKHHGPPIVPALPGAPSEWNLVTLPTYSIRPPDVLLIESQKGLLTQPIRGQHLVRVDGTVGLGIYGPAMVAGKTISQAREEIARVILSRLDPKTVKLEDVLDGLSVDVLAYNSSVYYIITDGAGLGEQVYRFPVTGSETVLDAISNINGLPVVASPKRIWVARRNMGPGPESVLPVDWKGITQHGAMNTNWQIMPGDRVYVQADPMRRFNNNLSKMLEPIERIMGATLLGSQTVNSIRSGTTGFR